MTYTKLDQEMKAFEVPSQLKLNPHEPIIARIDGKGFHTWTKKENCKHPFDAILTDSMRFTAKKLLANTDARLIYTQSDEITLVFHYPKPESQAWFDGKAIKIASILASMATIYFNGYYGPTELDNYAVFDARVFNVPTVTQAYRNLLWRYQDARRNSLSMLARGSFSHKQLLNKNSLDMMAMLKAIDIDWEELDSRFKEGSFFTKYLVERENELGKFMRTEITEVYWDFVKSQFNGPWLNGIGEYQALENLNSVYPEGENVD